MSKDESKKREGKLKASPSVWENGLFIHSPLFLPISVKILAIVTIFFKARER
jgi:hypothetical protein